MLHQLSVPRCFLTGLKKAVDHQGVNQATTFLKRTAYLKIVKKVLTTLIQHVVTIHIFMMNSALSKPNYEHSEPPLTPESLTAVIGE